MTAEFETVTRYCWGGCGRAVQLRASSIADGDVICCRDGQGDTRRLPQPFPGKVRTLSEHQHAGVVFQKIRDIWPDAEMIRQQWKSDEEWAYHLAAVKLDEIMANSLSDPSARARYYEFLDDEELFDEREKRREAFEKKQSKPC